MSQMMVPAGGYVITYDANGNKVMEATAAQVNSFLQGRGGPSLQTAGQAVQAVASAMQISTLKEIRDDVRESRRLLRRAVSDLIAYETDKDAVRAAKLKAVLDLQREVDRDQNKLIGNAIDQAWIQLAGSGLQLAGSLQGSGMSGGIGGGIDAQTAVVGLGMGALLVAAFDDDDDDYRRRRDRD